MTIFRDYCSMEDKIFFGSHQTEPSQWGIQVGEHKNLYCLLIFLHRENQITIFF